MQVSNDFVVAKRLSQGVAFMFDIDDFRLNDPQHKGNFEILGYVKGRDRQARTISTDAKTYRIFADRSLKEVSHG